MTMITAHMSCLFILILIFVRTDQFDLETCRYPLGIETGKISDSAFSSSSDAGINSTASKARIRSEKNGWCPLNKVSTNTDEYIQIDLVNLTVITLIELQGKFSRKPNEQYADSFRIEYRREAKHRWIKYKDFSGRYILSGNTNSYIPTIRDILPSLIAKQIRIIPIVTDGQAKHICMRLELYGCSYQDGPVSYSIPQSTSRSYDIQLSDEAYDGLNENGTLKDGLGQLTDGILAGDDYRLAESVQGIGGMGYDWIGWKRKSPSMSDVTLLFYFDTLRQFTSIHLHTSNLFTRDIYAFHSILIANCATSTNARYSIISDDLTNIRARWINVTLVAGQEMLTKCLKVTLTFHNRSKWILLSEVLFQSTTVIDRIPLLTTTVKHHLPTVTDNEMGILRFWHWFLLAIGLLILLIILCIFIYVHWTHTSRHRRKIHKMTAHLKFDSSYQPITMRFPTKSRMNCCYANTNDSTISDGNSTCSTSHNDMRRHLIISTTTTTSPSAGRARSGSDFGTISTASPATVSTVYQSVINPYLTAVTNDVPNVTSNPYASIDMYTNPVVSENLKHRIDSIQGPCGNSIYRSLVETNDCDSAVSIARLSDDQLIIEECYSTMDGCFGTIVRGHLYLRHPYDVLKPILIKALTTTDPLQKELFDREHQLLHRLNHPNLVQFFGYTLKHSYALIEHSTLGDLYTSLSTSSDQRIFSMNVRLLLITQLSNALRYLESENLIHRDISARNCLIYPNYELKLTNTALASIQFQSHYCIVQHRRLPVRWMAPETISNNEFTCQSDIWSFGITLWEVMTSCSTLPYTLLNDEQVYQRLKLMGTHAIRSSGSLQLSKPECLSKELVDLMLECWRPFGERPTFHEIFNFFNRRLDGINII